MPLSTPSAEAIQAWLKVQERIMRDVPPGEDEGWLFISEFGTRIEESKFLKTVKGYVRYASLSESITLHSLRRFSLNKLAKHNLLAAQQIAGHKDTKTTLLYTKLDAGFIRDMHSETGVLYGVLGSKQAKSKEAGLDLEAWKWNAEHV